MNNDFAWLDVPAEAAAQRLLGCELVREIDGQVMRVRIVETEAYDQTDEASHAHRGRTASNDAMFQSAGHLYVYFTYGMHHCCNVVCGPDGYGSGVLIRAVEPLEGIETMEINRGGKTGKILTNGPGKVCQALQIDRKLSGHDLSNPPVRLIKHAALPNSEIVLTKRIGISRAVHELRRYYVAGSPYISKG